MSVLYHEILLSLLGHTGDVIVESNASSSGAKRTLAVAPDAAFVSVSERAVINEICAHGYYYQQICNFVRRNQHVNFSAAAYSGTGKGTGRGGRGRGLYLRALCMGLDEVLQDYRSLVLDIEQEVLARSETPLSRMKHMLRQYTLIFPPLFGLVQEVSGEGLAEAEAGPDDASEAKSKASADRKAIVDTTNEVVGDAVRAKGGQILDLLWRRSLAGVPEVRKCMERLLFHCNRVLFNQITSFVVHGLLTDPHGEFFIQRAGASARGASDGQSIERLWNTQFGIRLKMLPLSYIPVRVARTILFIGHAVCLLQHPRIARHIESQYGERVRAPSFTWTPDGDAQRRVLSRRPGSSSGRTTPVESKDRRQHATADAGLTKGFLPARELRSFERALVRLGSAPVFDTPSVEAELTRIRLVVNRHLCDLVVRRGQLGRHLRALKDFYFLARGEFYQTFIEEGAQRFFREPTFSKSAKTLAERAFLGAAQMYGIDDDAFFSRFSIYLDEPHFNFQKFSAPAPSEVKAQSWNGDDSGEMGVGGGSRASRTRGSSAQQIALVGAAQISQEGELRLGGDGPSLAAAAWYRFRRSVDTRSTIQATFLSDVAAGEGVSAEQELCLVFQNSSRTAKPAAGPLGSFSAIPNVVAVELRWDATTARVRVCSNGAARARRTDSSSVSETASVSSRFSGSLSPPVVLARGEAPAPKPATPYAFRVEYAPGLLKVFVYPVENQGTALNERALVEVKVSLPQTIRLENGRAWIGFTTRGAGAPVRLLSWSYKGDTSRASAEAWRHLRLDYKIDPPLDLVLSETSLEQYNALFSFLFEVKRVQLALQDAWTTQQLAGRQLTKSARARMLRAWLLRHRMQFLIDNLQFYLQVDVLDVQYAELEAAVRRARTFDEVSRAHAAYLAALTEQCFLHAGVIHRAFRRIFATCTDFCNVITLQSRGMQDLDLRRVEQLEREFKLQSTFIFSMLAQTTGQNASPHLAQLVLRIDFNRNYTREARAGVKVPTS